MGTHNRITVGERHGKLVVLASDPAGTSKHPRYNVRCDCGHEQSITGTTFRVAKGCHRCTHGGQPRLYGDRAINGSKLYSLWVGMRRRCRAKDDPRCAPWAGRGISVCPEWQNSFVSFETWARASGYRDGLSIDRIDVDGNYEPKNCQWVTRSVNSQRARAAYVSVRRNDQFGDHLPIEACWGNA